MSSDCTQQHVARQGLAENVNEGFCVSMSRKALFLHLLLSFQLTPKLFLSCNKYLETYFSAKSTYLIGATLLPLTSSFFSLKLCTSVSSRHSKFLSIFLLII